jgi:hypothetical protein
VTNKNIPSPNESQETRNNQQFVEGQSKEVNVEGYAEITSLAQALKDLKFPASKDQILNFYQDRESNREVISRLKNIEDKQYYDVSEVAKSTHLVTK